MIAPWRLSDYDGHPKLVMFWATWCPHWKKLFPTIKSFNDRYQSEGLKVVVISIFDDGDFAEYAVKHDLTMDILHHGDALAERLNVPGTPTVIELDGHNQIVFGAADLNPLDTTMERAIELHVSSHTKTN